MKTTPISNKTNPFVFSTTETKGSQASARGAKDEQKTEMVSSNHGKNLTTISPWSVEDMGEDKKTTFNYTPQRPPCQLKEPLWNIRSLDNEKAQLNEVQWH